MQNDLGQACVEPPQLGFSKIAPRVKAAIEAAEHEVLYIGYKLEGGCDGENDLIESLNYLSKKAQAQNKMITVRFIVDKIAGIAGLFFHNRLPTLWNRKFPNLDFQYANHSHFGLGSFHQKQLIVDNHTAILMSGEFSFANNYKNNYKGWIEISTILQGQEMVRYIRNGFLTSWNSKQTQVLSEKKRPLRQEITSTAEQFSTKEKVPMLYLYKKANGYLFRRNYLSPHAIAVQTAIKNAKKVINIMMPNINEPYILRALAKAYARGVKINIITGRTHNDLAESLPFMGGTNQQALKKLVEYINKEDINHYSNLDIRFWADESGKVVEHHGKRTLHAKLVIVDDVVIAGSSVIDKQSTLHSQEGDVCIESKTVAATYFNNIFLPILNRSKNVFLHSKNYIKTPAQATLLTIENYLQRVITVLENKIATLLSQQDKKDILVEVLGESTKPNTLYFLRNEILESKKKAQHLLQAEVTSIAYHFFSITNKRILKNPKIIHLQENESFLGKIKRIISDGFKKLYFQYIQTNLSTIGLCQYIGENSYRRLSKIAHPLPRVLL